MQNNFHAVLEGGYAESDLDDLATAVGAVVDTVWKPLWAEDVNFLYVEVTGLDDETDLHILDNTYAGGGEVTGGFTLPDNVTKAITLRSGFTGRSARGRVFWIGAKAADLSGDENIFTTAALNAWVSAVDDVRAAILVANWTPVIVSRFHNGSKRETGVTQAWTNTGYYDSSVDARRDRLPL
jgi:hypothetical protein